MKTHASSSPPSLRLPLWPPKREYNPVSVEMLMKFGSVVRVETLRHLTKITALRRKASRNKVLAAKHMASLQLLRTAGGNQAKLDARNEFESRQRGGEVGRATGCKRLSWLFYFPLFRREISFSCCISHGLERQLQNIVGMRSL